MPRTLTAGVSEKPCSFLPEKYQPDVEGMVWSCLADLYLLGLRRAELLPAMHRLDDWLTRAHFWLVAHPECPDREQRLQRMRDSQDRLNVLRGELNRLIGDVEALRRRENAPLGQQIGEAIARHGGIHKINRLPSIPSENAEMLPADALSDSREPLIYPQMAR